MSKTKLTPWFLGKVRPVREGVYERNYACLKGYDRTVGRVYCYWNGKRWGLYGLTKREAIQFADCSSSYQSIPWRGLAYDPSKP